MDMSQLELSSHEIVLADENLLTLIMLRVPYRKLKSLECVSKKWLYLIITQWFTSLLGKLFPLRASGLFIQRLPTFFDFDRTCPNKVYFVPLDDPTAPSPFRNLTFAPHDPFDPQRIRILGSCNGLLLCSTCFVVSHIKCNYYVYNPSTNQLAIVPKLPLVNVIDCLNLAFDPSKSPHYKVISFISSPPYSSDHIGDFHIYSSEIGTWTLSVQSFVVTPPMSMDNGPYWDGCIHWLGDLDFESVHVSTLSDGLYFNVNEGRLGTFPRPPIGVKSTSKKINYFEASEDHLHFIEICPHSTSLSVYEMKSDRSEWFIKY